MIYGIDDRVPTGRLILFAIQLVLSVFVASVLIANICGVSVSGALFGAGLATIIYLIVTKFRSPMYVSNSGAFVAPVMIALAAGGYTAVAIGGLTTCLVYCLFGYIFSKVPVNNIYKIFPRSLIGAVTAVIGITLMGFIGTYVQIDGVINQWGVAIALFTAIVTAAISHYARGVARILPFLLGILAGYVVAIIVTLTGAYEIVDFSAFNDMKLFALPDIALLHWNAVDLKAVLPVIVIYVAYTISAMMECLSDHGALSGIIGVDLYENPGLGRIFSGEGLANLAGSMFGGLGICSYGEGVACVGFSRVSSTMVTLVAALIMIALSFFAPVQAFITSIPSCVYAGVALILYGYIACSGIKMLQGVDLNNQKNLIMVSSVLSLGISGLAVGGTTFALSGTALGLVFGVIINFLLKDVTFSRAAFCDGEIKHDFYTNK